MRAEDLLAPIERKVEAVLLPALGKTVHVRAMFAIEGLRFGEALQACGTDRAGVLAAQLAFYLCDETGAPLLTVEQAATAAASTLTPFDVRAIVQAGDRLNTLGEEALEAARKNS